MNFSGRKLSAKLAIGFSIIMVLLVIITVLSLNRLSTINSEMKRIVSDDYRKVTISNNVIDQVNIIAVATRNIAISRDQAFIQKEKERIDAARSKYAQGMEELRKTVRRPEGIANLAEIDKAIDLLKPLNVKTMELGAAMQTEEVAKLVAEQLEPGQAKLLGAVENMIRYQEGKMAVSVKEADQVYTLALIILIVVSLVAIILGSGIAYYLTRSITKPINHVIAALSDAAQQVAEASGQLSGTSQSLAEGTQEQASSIEETSASLEEMSSMTKASADNANEANVIIIGSTKDMDRANQVMKDLITSMNEISAASENTQKIVKTIDEIAFQTNLLALNAAVEAARAGEAGAGFAVVADEVRNLAMRAAEAAKNTQVLIEGTVQKIHSGTELAQKTNEAFTKVAHDSVKIGQLINEIAAASKEQSQGVGQVNIAVSEVDKVVQQNAARAEESASASEELNAQAEQMKGFVREMDVLINGAGHQVK